MEIFWARQGQFLSKNMCNYLIPRNQRDTKLTRFFKIRVNFMPLSKVQRKYPTP